MPGNAVKRRFLVGLNADCAVFGIIVFVNGSAGDFKVATFGEIPAICLGRINVTFGVGVVINILKFQSRRSEKCQK